MTNQKADTIGNVRTGKDVATPNTVGKATTE